MDEIVVPVPQVCCGVKWFNNISFLKGQTPEQVDRADEQGSPTFIQSGFWLFRANNTM